MATSEPAEQVSPLLDRRAPVGIDLPILLTSLVGREAEVAAARDLLHRPEVRLLVLTGPGGVGKTRLAVAVAADARADFADGVRFFPLAAVRDPELVAGTIASALAVPEADGRSALDRLRDALRDRNLLLVLDNFEHLVAAAPLLPDLLRAAPNVKALVTSRAVLNIEGEHDLPVPPLACPNPARPVSATTLIETAAPRLFLARTRSDLAVTDANAPVIAELCRRLDGLPLAIELAAARGVALSPEALLALLEPRLPLLGDGPRGQPDRLRTMRDAIGWSYDILTADEQALFRRLAVFAGGVTLEAARAVAVVRMTPDPKPSYEAWQPHPLFGDASARRESESGVASSALLNSIVSLVNQSLVQEMTGTDGVPRFGMLETIQEFGMEQLTALGESEDVRRAHAGHFLAYAEAIDPKLWQPDQQRWMNRLAVDLGNLRAALAWADEYAEQENGAVELGLRLATAMWLFWQTRNHMIEGRRWLDRFLAREGGPPWARAAALHVAGLLAWMQKDDLRARQTQEAALAIWQGMGNGPLLNQGVARSQFVLALVAWREGETAAMVTLAESALARYRSIDDLVGQPLCLVVLAMVARAAGDHDRALALLEEAVGFFDRCGFTWGKAAARFYAAEVLADRRDYAPATARYLESATLAWSVGDKWATGTALGGLGTVAAALGQAEDAARLFGAADALSTAAGAVLPMLDRAHYDRTVAAVRASLGRAAFAAAHAAGAALTPAAAIAAGDEFAAHTVDIALVPAPPAHDFTRRELDVLRLLVEGQEDAEIARALTLSPRTISEHIIRMRQKLGLPNRTALAVYAVRHSVV